MALGAIGVSLFAASLIMSAFSAHAEELSPSELSYGLSFSCQSPGQAAVALPQVTAYLKSLGIGAELIRTHAKSDAFGVALREEYAGGSTLDIAASRVFNVAADLVPLLDPRGAEKLVPTVSKREIALALMHDGRKTKFSGEDCGVEQLKDDVGVRQTTVAWTQTVEFGWPEGGPASWNETFWKKGTPLEGVNLHTALTDMVVNPYKYSIGCYTAAKMVLAAGAIDYYTRIKRSPEDARKIIEALMVDGDPLVNLEPGVAWFFEEGFTSEDAAIPGKIMDVAHGVKPGNFVPGDWIYMLNPDEVSYQKTGYEGSNAIYLGMNKFSDYYNDHEHSFSYRQKLNEVYQWRHGVFSRTRDAEKVVPLTDSDYDQLSLSPEKGGLVIPNRIVPRPLK